MYLYTAIALIIPAVICSAHAATTLKKKIIDELNLARQHPDKYARLIEKLRVYYVGNLFKRPDEPIIQTEEGLRAVDEAIHYLRSLKPLPPLRLSSGLSAAARDHVLDQGKAGSLGHIGRDGSQPFERIERYGKVIGQVGENISYGPETARDIVIGLIVDDGVPGRGHRKNIFTGDYRLAGVATGYHARYHYMCVITFAEQFVPYRTFQKW